MNELLDQSQEPQPEPDDGVADLVSVEAFNRTRRKALKALDELHQGIFDEAEAQNAASLCLLCIAALIPQQSAAELRARSFKRDIDFKKAEVYLRLRNNPPDGKKPTETALTNMVIVDPDVTELYKGQGQAEKEVKELTNVLALLKDAHIMFRALIKKGQ